MTNFERAEKLYSKTIIGAKRRAVKALSPVIVKSKGGFDWLPQGHPLASGEEIVSRYICEKWRDDD